MGGAAGTNRGLATILVIAVVVILILSAYSAVSIASLQSQVSSLQSQNNYQQQVLADLGNQVSALQSEVYALTHPQRVGGSISVQTACMSISNDCEDGAYAITVLNNGTTMFGVDSSVYLSFKDATRLTSFGFNRASPPT